MKGESGVDRVAELSGRTVCGLRARREYSGFNPSFCASPAAAINDDRVYIHSYAFCD